MWPIFSLQSSWHNLNIYLLTLSWIILGHIPTLKKIKKTQNKLCLLWPSLYLQMNYSFCHYDGMHWANNLQCWVTSHAFSSVALLLLVCRRLAINANFQPSVLRSASPLTPAPASPPTPQTLPGLYPRSFICQQVASPDPTRGASVAVYRKQNQTGC